MSQSNRDQEKNLDAHNASELRVQVRKLSERNSSLASLLQSSRNKLQQLAADVNELAEPASSYGIFLGYSGRPHDSRRDAEVYTNNRPMRLKISPQVEPGTLKVGQLVRLGDGMVVVEGCGFPRDGQLATLSERIGSDRAVVLASNNEESIAIIAEHLRDSVRSGDTVLIDSRAGIILEHVHKTEVSQLQLEEVPNVSFEDIGGLDAQISQIRDSVELPFLHPELYRDYALSPPKGVLLYGPPGCGKTLIAKAVANPLAQQMGEESSSYFLNVKGPELLNKFVGETERRIRMIFERARELAAINPNRPVIIFFDEMESIFRTRGSGVSSDMETTVVPQLLTELDGVEKLDNVIIIGATNRDELIDPAIMRPGRLDIKVRVNRPNKQGAKDIFDSHFPEDVPHIGQRQDLIEFATDELFGDRPFVRVHFDDGSDRVLHYRDFVSGAMIANIMSRAKKLAIKDSLLNPDGPKGIDRAHLSLAIAAEQAESEHLPTKTNADEWVKTIDGGSSSPLTQGLKIESIEFLGFRSSTWHVS